MPRILIKRGSATQWTNSTNALLAGELGLDTTNNIIKVGDGTTLWNSLSGLTLTSSQVSELAQDALSTAFSNGTHSNITVTYNDNANSISLATGPDVVTTTSLNNTLTNPTSGYVSIGDVGVADGVASLGPDGKIPDSEIPAGIARDSEIPANTDSLAEGTTNKYFTNERAQDAIGESLGTGLSYNDTTGAISIDATTTATRSYVDTSISNLVNSAPTTLNTLNELAIALNNDPGFATTITTALGNKLDSSTAATTYLTQSNASSTYLTQTNASNTYLTQASASSTYLTQSNASSIYAPKSGPTFTGIVSGITKSMVGLANVDNTSDEDKYKNDYAYSGLTNIALASASHKFKVLEVSSNSPISVVIPSDAQDSGWQVGSFVEIRQAGDGQVTVNKDSAVTYNAPDNQFKTRVKWSSIFVEKRGSNSWIVTGDATA